MGSLTADDLGTQYEATFNVTVDPKVALTEAAEFHAPFYSNSLFYPSDRLLTNASTLSFARYTYNGTGSDVSWYVLWDIFGGKKSAISAVPQDATAYNARDMFMNLQVRGLSLTTFLRRIVAVLMWAGVCAVDPRVQHNFAIPRRWHSVRHWYFEVRH